MTNNLQKSLKSECKLVVPQREVQMARSGLLQKEQMWSSKERTKKLRKRNDKKENAKPQTVA